MSSIDIVIPCYKYGKFLRECVESVLTQGVPDIRVLVIDDCSPDDSGDVARQLAAEYPQVTARVHAVNQGHIATYNEGIDWTEGDYMLLLSADDYLLPGALTAAMEAMDRSPHIGLSIGAASEIDATGREQRQLTIPVDFGNQPTLELTGAEFTELCIRERSSNIVPTPTGIVRTRLLKQSGGYRADLPHTADFEIWLRLAALSGVVVHKRLQAVYRRHTSNMSWDYYRDNCLRDLQQRLAAFDVFADACAALLPELPSLQQRFRAGLAREAVLQASAAFNERRFDLSHQLADLARSFSPGIEGSRAWKLLGLKKLLGHRITMALLPFYSIAQQGTPRG